MSVSTNIGTFEECADEMNDFIAALERYPTSVLVFVLRAHLAGLLQALLIHGHWTRAEASEFLEEMLRETLQAEEG